MSVRSWRENATQARQQGEHSMDLGDTCCIDAMEVLLVEPAVVLIAVLPIAFLHRKTVPEGKIPLRGQGGGSRLQVSKKRHRVPRRSKGRTNPTLPGIAGTRVQVIGHRCSSGPGRRRTRAGLVPTERPFSQVAANVDPLGKWRVPLPWKAPSLISPTYLVPLGKVYVPCPSMLQRNDEQAATTKDVPSGESRRAGWRLGKREE